MILYILICLFGFLCGYIFCIYYNQVEQLLKMVNLLSSILSKEITSEEALKRWNEFKLKK